MKSKISVILFLLYIFPGFCQSGVKVISSDINSFLFEYTPQFSDSSVIKINNSDFLRLKIKGGISGTGKYGDPSLPIYTLPIGVPSELGNTIQVVSSNYKEISGKILPVPYLVKSGGVATEKFETGDKYYNYNSIGEVPAIFGEYDLVRGLPVQLINVQPVEFSAAESRIRIYTKLLIKVSFASARNSGTGVKDGLLDGTLINYPVARFWKADNKKLNKMAVVNSVLQTGTWYKFETPAEGIYKITKSMLSQFGIDPATVDPRTIKIYNNGGKPLPEDVTIPAPSDLIENAIYIEGESDGKFNDADFILFYGRGTNFWEYDSLSKAIVRRFNPYSNKNYYWITSGGTLGKRMQLKQSLPAQPGFVQNTSRAFVYLEDEKRNLAGSGRYFVGDEFNETTISRTYTNKLDGIISGSRINYSFNFVNSDYNNIELRVDDNGNIIYDSFIPGTQNDIQPDFSSGYLTAGSGGWTGTLPDSRSLLKFSFSSSGLNSKGYLSWFEINYNKTLTPTGDQLTFFSKDTTSSIEYDLSGFSNSNIRVYDITDFANTKIITNPILLSGGEFRFISQVVKGNNLKYYAVGNDNFITPINPVVAVNSNIHGFQDGAQFIIITTKDFKDQALRLKSFKENHPKLNISTYVADVEQVFNEFSGGMVDVGGIRNFVKYAFDSWGVKPQYILLFGDGTYDYKNIEGNSNNFIIPWETVNSLNTISSYPMDDFYARISGSGNLVDLGIGRLTINSPGDAKIVVDKIIAYESETDKGNWQNLLTMVADDQWTTQGYEGNYHVQQSEELASGFVPPSYDINKIYLGAYPTVITSIGRSKPGVTVDLVNAVNNGTLLLNFIGHGAPNQWTHEGVFYNSTTIPQFNNDKLFFLTAATCDFGYFDNTTVQSGAELLDLKEGSGAIGAFTATRPVYSTENATLNEAFYGNMLESPKDTLNLPIPIGKAYFMTKHAYAGDNDNKYHLLCDPSLRLAIPQFTASFDSINGQALLSNVQIKALSNSRISGSIKNGANSNWNNFNGDGILTVFDSQRQVGLPEQDNYPTLVQGGVIFRGMISIANGKFNSSFIVPKDISYENKNGKVVLLFNNNSVDGLGYTSNVIIGGTDSTAVNNKTGPKIEIYFDDVSYKNSYLVNPNSKLIVRLSDPSGLNTTGTGIGHKIEGILNNDLNNPIDFTTYFTGDLDAGGKSGEVNYQFNNLAEGHYQIDIKAWDVFNNFSTETAYFNVVSGNNLEVQDVYNYPNPFSGKTTFTFQQNLTKVFDVKIKVYTVAGRMIREIDKYSLNQKFVTIDWDGKDQDGNQIANGTYFYKVILKSTDGAFSRSVIGKLAVIR